MPRNPQIGIPRRAPSDVKFVQAAPDAFGRLYRFAKAISTPRIKSPVYLFNAAYARKMEHLPAECHAILKSAFHAALRQRFHHRVRRRVVSAAGGCGEYECLQLVLLPGGIFRQHFVNDFAGHADDFRAGALLYIRVCPRIRGRGFRLPLAP